MSSARAEQTHSTTPFVRLANGWLQYTDETSQAPYYYNKASGETRWSFPPEATQSHGGVIHNQHGDEAARVSKCCWHASVLRVVVAACLSISVFNCPNRSRTGRNRPFLFDPVSSAAFSKADQRSDHPRDLE
eukprot:6172801-Pleurochrysis_carterae.AAC.2